LDLFDSAQERLERFVTRAPSEIVHAYRLWKGRLSAARPLCVLSCSSNFGHAGHGVVVAAREAGIPRIFIISLDGAEFAAADVVVVPSIAPSRRGPVFSSDGERRRGRNRPGRCGVIEMALMTGRPT